MLVFGATGFASFLDPESITIPVAATGVATNVQPTIKIPAGIQSGNSC